MKNPLTKPCPDGHARDQLGSIRRVYLEGIESSVEMTSPTTRPSCTSRLLPDPERLEIWKSDFGLKATASSARSRQPAVAFRTH